MVIGGLLGSWTCRLSAVPLPSWLILSIAFTVLPSNLLMVFTVLILPRLNTPPTPEPASAAEAVPSVSAAATANTVNFLLEKRARRTVLKGLLCWFISSSFPHRPHDVLLPDRLRPFRGFRAGGQLCLLISLSWQ